jgi:ketosteroid isomerase-like protein
MPSDGSRDVLHADDLRLAASLAGDATALRGLFAPDFSYTHSNGLREGGEAYIDRLESGAVRYLDMRRREARVVVDGDTAVVEGVASMTYQPRGGEAMTLDTLYLAVWRRTGPVWRMSHYASTSALSD